MTKTITNIVKTDSSLCETIETPHVGVKAGIECVGKVVEKCGDITNETNKSTSEDFRKIVDSSRSSTPPSNDRELKNENNIRAHIESTQKTAERHKTTRVAIMWGGAVAAVVVVGKIIEKVIKNRKSLQK